MSRAHEDLFDRKLKSLAGQRVKHYLFDGIRAMNTLAIPWHALKCRAGTFTHKKINLGCGATYLPGWINVDGNPFRKKDLWLDLRLRWPFRNDSVDGLVAAHVIEHLFDEELDHFFVEAKRVLKEGAFVHIEVPSLELLVQNYLSNKDGIYFNELVHWHGAHHQVFDSQRLKTMLSTFGFQNSASHLGRKQSSYLNQLELDEICLRPEETLTVEAVKGTL